MKKFKISWAWLIALPIIVIALPVMAAKTAYDWHDSRFNGPVITLQEYLGALRFDANCIVHNITNNPNLFIF